jgi:ATP-binding cassette subfamily C exporter for protease/lipase
MVAGKSVWDELRVAANLRWAFALVMLFSFFVNVLILTSPIYMMQVYDRVLVSGQVETLLLLSLMALIALAVLGVLDGVRGLLLTRLGRYLDVALRDPILINAVARSQQTGTPFRKIIDDLATMRGYLGSPAILPFIDAPWAPFFIAIIFLLHPWLGVLSIAAAAVLIGLTLVNDHLSRTLLRDASAQQAIANEFAAQAMQNSEVVHAMGMRDAVGARYRRHVEEQSRANQRAGDIGSSFQAATKTIRIFVQSAALGLGAYLVIGGHLTPGGMIASSIILGRALAPIEQGIGSWRQFVGARDAYRSVKEFLSGIPADEGRIGLPDLKGKVSVEDVSYRLQGASEPILKRISFTLEPGQVLALVGPSASGKSTLCRVLVGAVSPTIGSVRIDGAEVTALSPADARRSIGYMPQTVELFAGTVKDNIARLGEVDENAVLEAARLAGCHNMILRLDNGYETEIGPRGAFLSGGQRQRIGLARALYGNPRVLVLDEPNSNLDQEGEVALIEAIHAVKRAGVTVIVVNHRSTLLQPVDKLAVIRGGVLEKFGDRDEVLQEMAPKRPTLVPMGGGNAG